MIEYRNLRATQNMNRDEVDVQRWTLLTASSFWLVTASTQNAQYINRPLVQANAFLEHPEAAVAEMEMQPA